MADDEVEDDSTPKFNRCEGGVPRLRDLIDFYYPWGVELRDQCICGRLSSFFGMYRAMQGQTPQTWLDETTNMTPSQRYNKRERACHFIQLIHISLPSDIQYELQKYDDYMKITSIGDCKAYWDIVTQEILETVAKDWSYTRNIVARFDNLCMKPGETEDGFRTRLEKTYKMLQVVGESRSRFTLAEKFLRGLRLPESIFCEVAREIARLPAHEITLCAVSRSIRNVRSVEEYMKDYEPCKQSGSSSRSAAELPAAKRQMRVDMRCFNCGGLGHSKKECTSPMRNQGSGAGPEKAETAGK